MTPGFEPPRALGRRVCLLGGGGDAPGVNAIVRGFVHAAHRYGFEVYRSRYGFEGLLDPELDLTPPMRSDVRGILPMGGCILGCSTRVNPFFMPAPGRFGTLDLASPSSIA
ncbi:6-phosphofructokinase [Pendulispora brunnea]|uniref:6-phosphofructokinase n=1 Tax=Pendulispora brunnea TaxID=2905690 RepID=A0ABZ2JZ29_9BACT